MDKKLEIEKNGKWSPLRDMEQWDTANNLNISEWMILDTLKYQKYITLTHSSSVQITIIFPHRKYINFSNITI